MSDVVLFLDVDGCLSPIPLQSTEWGDWVEYPRLDSPTPVPAAPIYLSQKMADELAALPVERRWLTTWGEHANTRLCPLLGWESLYYSDPYSWSNNVWWKLEVISAHIQVDGRPFIWVDDWLSDYLPVLGERLQSAPRRLLISPESRVGVTPLHIEAMRQFIEER